MALLTKLRSATLVEALVATALIVVIFIISSLVLNNLLLNSFSGNTHAIDNRLFELEYEARYNSITLPYTEEFSKWSVSVKKEEDSGKSWLKIRALNKITGKELLKSRLCGELD